MEDRHKPHKRGSNLRNRYDPRNWRDDQDDGGYGQSDRGRSNYGRIGRNNYDGNQRRNRPLREDHDHKDNFDNSNSEQGAYSSEKRIFVNSNCIGELIGVGGSNIKRLQQETGATILVDRQNRGVTTEITISGTDEQVAVAEQKIIKIDNPVSMKLRNNYSRYCNRNDNSRSYVRNDQSECRQGRNDYTHNKSEPPARFSYQTFSNVTPTNWTKVYAESDKKAATHLAKLPPIIKELYHEDPEVANMSPLEVSEFRLKNFNMSVSREFLQTGEDLLAIPNPIKTFEQVFRSYPEIMKIISDQGLEIPTSIQAQGFPIVLSGQDMILITQNESEKTQLFLIPASIHIQVQPIPLVERIGPTVIFLTSTRERVLQIESEMKKYSSREVKCVCLHDGGDDKAQAKVLLENKPNIIIATPEKFNRFLEYELIPMHTASFILLDRTDDMLEVGYECDIRGILQNVRPDRHIIMTSSTWPLDVKRLAEEYLVNPVLLKSTIDEYRRNIEIGDSTNQENIYNTLNTSNLLKRKTGGTQPVVSKKLKSAPDSEFCTLSTESKLQYLFNKLNDTRDESKSLREENKSLREENKSLREENKLIVSDLRKVNRKLVDLEKKSKAQANKINFLIGRALIKKILGKRSLKELNLDPVAADAVEYFLGGGNRSAHPYIPKNHREKFLTYNNLDWLKLIRP